MIVCSFFFEWLKESESTFAVDLMEFYRSLEGIWRPIDLAWATVPQAPI